MHPHEDVTGEQPDESAIADVSAADQPQEEHVHLPPLSIWPMTTAAGVALGGLGMVTTYPFWILGLVLMAFGLVSWVQELRHEPH
jgi:hypothetical protein